MSPGRPWDGDRKLLAAATAALESRYSTHRHLVRMGEDPPTYWSFASLMLGQAWQALGDAQFGAEWPAIVDAVADTQVRREGDYFDGNFTWLADDIGPEDPNAVVFVLRGLLPPFLREPDLLGRAPRAAEVIERGLEAIERIALLPTYSNIALSSAACLILGRELIGRPSDVGLERLRAVALDVMAGAPTEFNSPNYGWHAVAPLLLVREHSGNPEARALADVLGERLAVHVASRHHSGTRSHLGPHSRCYTPALWGLVGEAAHFLALATGISWLPMPPPDSYAAVELLLLAPLADWSTVREAVERTTGVTWETAGSSAGIDIYTYAEPSWGMGTASRQFHAGVGNLFVEGEMNNWLVHYRRGDESRVVTSRFIDNDRHIGCLGPAPDRPSTASFYEQGRFIGTQDARRSILVHALEPSDLRRTSSKLLLVWTAPPDSLRVMAPGIDALASDVRALPLDEWIVVADDAFWLGFRVLRNRALSANTPGDVLVRVRDGRTEFEVYLFHDSERTIWEVCEIGGVFWHGLPYAVVAAEAADSTTYATAGEFLEALRTGSLDVVRTAGLSAHVDEVRWAPEGGPVLTLAFDADDLHPVARTRAGEPVQPPDWTGPTGAQLRSGRVAGSSWSIEADEPVWAYANGAGLTIVAPVRPATVTVLGGAAPQTMRLRAGERRHVGAGLGL